LESGAAPRGTRPPPPVGVAVPPVGEFWQCFVGDGRMGLKAKTGRKIHFASSFVITYPNNILTISALRDAGLQRHGKHAREIRVIWTILKNLLTNIREISVC